MCEDYHVGETTMERFTREDFVYPSSGTAWEEEQLQKVPDPQEGEPSLVIAVHRQSSRNQLRTGAQLGRALPWPQTQLLRTKDSEEGGPTWKVWVGRALHVAAV